MLYINYFTDTPPENVSFDKILYEGTIQDGVVEHETIMIKGYSGSRVPLSGGGYKLEKVIPTLGF